MLLKKNPSRTLRPPDPFLTPRYLLRVLRSVNRLRWPFALQRHTSPL